MKFEETLQSHAVPEWASKYVDYTGLKFFIEAVQKEFPECEQLPVIAKTDSHPETLLRKRQSISSRIAASFQSHQFVSGLQNELDKINVFYREMCDKTLQRFETLSQQLQLYVAQHNGGGSRLSQLIVKKKVSKNAIFPWGVPKEGVQDKKQLCAAFEELYRQVELLKGYQFLNFEGLRKIVKKNDKITGMDLLNVWLPKFQNAEFYTSKALAQVTIDIEKMYVKHLAEDGNRQAAMKKLRVPSDAHVPLNSTTLLFGVFLGVILSSAIVITIAAYTNNVVSLNGSLQVFRVFRGVLVVALLVFGIGIDIYAWEHYRINYKFIFSLNARTKTAYGDFFSVSGFLLVMWCASVVMYVFSPQLQTPFIIGPIVIIAVNFCTLVNPFSWVRAGRAWLFRILGRILVAPFVLVPFQDFWLADQLTSLTVPILDFYYTACYFSTGFDATAIICTSPTFAIRPILYGLPAWLRLLQSLRRYFDTRKAIHVVNAGKYLSTLAVVLFSTLAAQYPIGTFSVYFYFWVFAAAINAIYSFIWDIRMDWGLFCRNAKYKFLRNKLTFSPKFYYFAIINNFVCRLLFSLNLSVGWLNLFYTDGLVAVLAIAEVYRRVIWNVIRLENEHLNNCDEFRATKDVPLPYQFINAGDLQTEAQEEDEGDEGKLKKSKSKKSALSWAHRRFTSNSTDHDLSRPSPLGKMSELITIPDSSDLDPDRHVSNSTRIVFAKSSISSTSIPVSPTLQPFTDAFDHPNSSAPNHPNSSAPNHLRSSAFDDSS